MKKILVVDDEPDLLELMARRLELNGFEVVQAASGEEALEKAVRERPNAILLDIVMPGLSGYGVLAALKQDPKTRDIPVYLQTARIDSLDSEEFKKNGAEELLVKPVDLVLLGEKLKKLP